MPRPRAPTRSPGSLRAIFFSFFCIVFFSRLFQVWNLRLPVSAARLAELAHEETHAGGALQLHLWVLSQAVWEAGQRQIPQGEEPPGQADHLKTIGGPRPGALKDEHPQEKVPRRVCLTSLDDVNECTHTNGSYRQKQNKTTWGREFDSKAPFCCNNGAALSFVRLYWLFVKPAGSRTAQADVVIVQGVRIIRECVLERSWKCRDLPKTVTQ